MDHRVKIISKESLNHDVIQFHLERPKDFSFLAGQAIEMTIHEPEQKGPSPFTFTGLATSPFLELTIKIYEEHKGLTSTLAKKKIGDTVNIGDPWDSYLNKGPGVFIAGGAGLTPFLAILRQLKVDNNIGSSYLFFSNKTPQDVFMESELKSLLGNRYISVITRDTDTSKNGRLDANLLKKHISNFAQPFYVCGPPGFMESIQETLTQLGAKKDMVVVSF